ncbi:MAG: pilus assembly protein PilP [Gammaproteobacteria bacterium]|nr:pilus assembly protein PilP [Gammaproteobacteria bacterium]
MKTKAQAKHPIEALPPKPQKVNNKYLGLNHRSPFISSEEFVKSQVASSNAIQQPDLERPKEVLEKIPIENLVMVGSLKKDNTVWALIADSAGRIYKVKVGSYIGENYGQVTEVHEKNLEIKEAISNGFGGWQSNTVIMKLKE